MAGLLKQQALEQRANEMYVRKNLSEDTHKQLKYANEDNGSLSDVHLQNDRKQATIALPLCLSRHRIEYQLSETVSLL